VGIELASLFMKTSVDELSRTADCILDAMAREPVVLALRRPVRALATTRPAHRLRRACTRRRGRWPA
jgi:hypothetical protein